MYLPVRVSHGTLCFGCVLRTLFGLCSSGIGQNIVPVSFWRMLSPLHLHSYVCVLATLVICLIHLGGFYVP